VIIPFLDGFLSFSKAPITWLIILLNVFLFSQNYGLSQDCQSQFESWYKDNNFLYTQGQIYKQFSKKRDVARVEDMTILGRLAFKDELFLNQAPLKKWVGDSIAIQTWREDISLFMLLRSYYPPMLLGVSDSQKDFFSFISYQFYHESFYHMLGNVLLVLLIGGFLERRYSGLIVFSVYILGGFLAAFFYSQSSGMSGSPLVGASGSLCALLGFFFVMEFYNKTRLFYMLLPFKKYSGFVLVPTCYWVIWLCMIEDLSGLLSQPQIYSSGVAHLVHLFGFFVGICIALIFKLVSQWSFWQPSQTNLTH
jgi:membrane associated rhomboid family serine protease